MIPAFLASLKYLDANSEGVVSISNVVPTIFVLGLICVAIYPIWLYCTKPLGKQKPIQQTKNPQQNTNTPQRRITQKIKAIDIPKNQWLNILRKQYNPTEFEEYIADIWEALGYETYLTPTTGDHGADVIATKSNERVVIECKRYAIDASVGNKVVRGVVAHKSDLNNPATHAIVVTTGRFTKKAIEAGEKFGVELIGPDELVELIETTHVFPTRSK